MFDNFKLEDLVKITKLEISKLKNKLSGRNIKLSTTPSFNKYIAQKAEKEKMGARPIQRLIQKNLENKLSVLLLDQSLIENQEIIFSFQKEEVAYSIKEV